MKLLVCVCKTPDTTAKITFTDNNTTFDANGITFIMNPTDEWYALVRAIELKEQHGGSVTVINVGLNDSDQIIRKALAIGADDAVRINKAPTDAYDVAAQIAEYAKDKGFDIVFTGKETIDYNGFNVGAMLSELLDLPFVSLANKLDVNDGKATISRDIEGGIENLSVATPLVVSAQKGMAEQRIPNMRGIMAARRKPLQVVEPAAIEPLTTITNYELPPERSDIKYVDAENPAELIRLLHEEAKVI